MSWFDATGFANLAKSALKEAQKTIDKALDIKEDENGQPVSQSNITASVEVSEEDTDFFNNWGLQSSGRPAVKKNDTGLLSSNTLLPSSKVEDLQNSQTSGPNKLTMSTSLWGSFTGSFFDNPSTTPGDDTGSTDTIPVALQPKKSNLFRPSTLSQETSSPRDNRKTSWEQGDLYKTLEDESTEFGFSQSKLVVESEDGDTDARSRLSSCDADEDQTDDCTSAKLPTPLLDIDETLANTSREDIYVPLEVVRRRDHSTSSYKYNRLSVISTESDRKSSESVEVLGYGSGFTTSPETPTSPSFSGTSSGFRVSVAASTPESVEVIPDTPSSVEVIGELSSGRSSRTTASPYLSPLEPPDPPNTLAVRTQLDPREIDQISPESVEVIPEEDEDDRSIADDSYASASEGTATGTITIMEQPQFMLVKSDTVDSIKSLKSPHHKVYFAETPTKIGLAGMMDSYNEKMIFEEPISIPGNRAGLSLPLNPVTDLIGLSEGIDKLKVSESSNEDSMISDKTLVGIDSSFEGMISSDDTLVTTLAEDTSSDGTSKSQPASSYYVKSMLAEAMGEDETKQSRRDDVLVGRDRSPNSSESRSDMVKVESEQTSGHTSGDEIETTTSSDIEIISSPNGCDSSSTQSARHSPAKLLQHATRGKLVLGGERSDSPGFDLLGKIGGKVKGHQRELSETSSGGSEDSHCSEVEKLMRRIAEMSEILEARESKLIDMSRINMDLQENNADLRNQLESALQSHVGSQDVQKIGEEFTQRLSAMERKFQQAVREKEALRKQLDKSKTETATRLSTVELETLVREKDEIIEDLRREGEKLSNKELQHSNIIKKLRVKEKECDGTIANQKDQLEELGEELERLKRSLAAKEDVERTQIEAVHQLTAKTKRQEKELHVVKSQLDDAMQKVITLNTSLEAASKELSESKKESASKDKEMRAATLSTELSVRQELVASVEETRMAAQREQYQLMAQVDDLQDRLKVVQEQHSGRESKVRQECSDLLRRLESAEARNEELSQSVSVVTRPLLRQIESLQAGHSTQQKSWEKQERSLTETVGDLQARVTALADQERSSRDQCVTLRSRVSAAESKLLAANQEAAHLKDELEKMQAQLSQLRHAKDKEVSETQSSQESLKEQLQDLKREVKALEQQLAVERAATEAEKRRTNQLQEQLREREADRGQVGRGSPTTPQSSPTLSFGHASLSESISSGIWPQFQDDPFECGSTSGRYNVYDSLRSGNTTTLLEGLQAQLKMREGEVQQLQWELSRRENERVAFTSELSLLTARVDAQDGQLADAAALRVQHDEVQQRYDALLQMYGEKVEEAQELRLDLEDVKEVYKSQIDQLLKKESLQDI